MAVVVVLLVICSAGQKVLILLMMMADVRWFVYSHLNNFRRFAANVSKIC